MPLKVNWIEVKSPDWKIATIQDGDKVYESVSINRTSKKGETFPDFDDLQAGRETNGVLWVSPANKNYLFPPVPTPTPGVMGTKPAWSGGGMKAVMKEKQENIGHSMDRKENAITLAGSMRDATLITIAQMQGKDFTTAEFQAQWLSWRTWLIDQAGRADDISETKSPF